MCKHQDCSEFGQDTGVLDQHLAEWYKRRAAKVVPRGMMPGVGWKRLCNPCQQATVKFAYCSSTCELVTSQQQHEVKSQHGPRARVANREHFTQVNLEPVTKELVSRLPLCFRMAKMLWCWFYAAPASALQEVLWRATHAGKHAHEIDYIVVLCKH